MASEPDSPRYNRDIGSGHGEMASRTKNPFRTAFMRRNFDAAIKCFDEKHRDFIHPTGTRCIGNAWATHFWRGFDGVSNDYTSIKDSAAYAMYRAGQEVAKAITRGAA